MLIFPFKCLSFRIDYLFDLYFPKATNIKETKYHESYSQGTSYLKQVLFKMRQTKSQLLIINLETY